MNRAAPSETREGAMGLRPRRRNVVVWSSSGVPAGRGRTRRTRIRRIRWWLRTGVLLTIIGVLWLARAARTYWEPVLLLAGTALTVTGIALSAAGLFFPGLLVLIVTLLKEVARYGALCKNRVPVRSVSPACAAYLVQPRSGYGPKW